MSQDIHITVFTDRGLELSIDLDADSAEPRSPSIYLKTPTLEIRQFCTDEQLKDLRDKLNTAFPIEEPVIV